MNSPNQQLQRTAFAVIAMTVLVKVFGALRDLTLSYYYGSTAVSDAYILATTIPVTIFAFIYEGIGASFIPMCARIKEKNAINKLTSNLISFLLIITAVLVVLIEFFPQATVRLFASGFTGSTLETAITFTRISVLGVFFSCAVYVIVYYLNYKSSFIPGAIRSIPMSVVVMVSIAMSAKTHSIMPMAWGVPISLFVELLFLLIFSKRHDFRYRPVLVFDDSLKQIMMWSIPVVLSSAVADLNAIIDRQFASWMVEGGISVLTYAGRTLNVFRTTLFVPIITVLFPTLARAIEDENIEGMKKVISTCFSVLILLALPLTVGIFALSVELIDVIFSRGAFGKEAALMTSGCLAIYSIALLGYAFIAVSTKVYYAQKNMTFPMRASLLGVGINLIANAILVQWLGIYGLAVGTVISIFVIAAVQFIKLRREYALDIKQLLTTFWKSLLATGTMALALILLRIAFRNSAISALAFMFLSAIIGALVYGIMIALLQVDEAKVVLSMIKNRIKR